MSVVCVSCGRRCSKNGQRRVNPRRPAFRVYIHLEGSTDMRLILTNDVKELFACSLKEGPSESHSNFVRRKRGCQMAPSRAERLNRVAGVERNLLGLDRLARPLGLVLLFFPRALDFTLLRRKRTRPSSHPSSSHPKPRCQNLFTLFFSNLHQSGGGRSLLSILQHTPNLESLTLVRCRLRLDGPPPLVISLLRLQGL